MSLLAKPRTVLKKFHMMDVDGDESRNQAILPRITSARLVPSCS